MLFRRHKQPKEVKEVVETKEPKKVVKKKTTKKVGEE